MLALINSVVEIWEYKFLVQIKLIIIIGALYFSEYGKV